MPLFAPVISARRPAWLGIAETAQPFPIALVVADRLMLSSHPQGPHRPLHGLRRPLASEPPHILVENAVRLQVPGNKEENQHQGNSPAEYLHRQRAHQTIGPGSAIRERSCRWPDRCQPSATAESQRSTTATPGRSPAAAYCAATTSPRTEYARACRLHMDRPAQFG